MENGLGRLYAASKTALARMAEFYPLTATAEPARPLHFRQRRATPTTGRLAISGALALSGLFCLAVTFALVVALLIERCQK